MNVSKTILRALALGALLVLLGTGASPAEGGLTVSAAGAVRGYTDNSLRVSAPAAGLLTVTVSDQYNLYRTLTVPVEAGEQELTWDGLSDNGKRIGQYNGEYRLRAVLRGTDGGEWTAETGISVTGSRQTLLLALPSSGTLYLADSDWFVELQTVRQDSGDKVYMEVCRADRPDQPVLSRAIPIADEVSFRFYWKGGKRNALGPGDYILTFWCGKNARVRHAFPLRMEEGSAPAAPVGVTGEIMPAEGAGDSELWRLMREPSVVVDIKDTAHQTVYAAPDLKAEALGTLHGQTQALQVLEEPENGWAKIAAFRHEDGQKITGYVPLSRLKVAYPNGPYGLLVDKAAQRLIVFENGERIAELPVSTGLPTDLHPERETTAGVFLTSEHIGDFISERRHYSDVIRYDGGNLLHSAGHRRDGRHCDFTEQLPLLGQKASHGCVRIPPFAVDESGIDSWWLYTHLPYHTRVIVTE